MDTLATVGRAQRRIVKGQRRLWLAQLLMWPTVLLTGAGLLAVVALVMRRRTRAGRHELPETPGAHRADAEHAGTDGQLPHLQPPGA